MLINNAVLTGSFIVNGVNYITNTPTTGSNTFVGTQTISGSTLMTGSLGVTGSVSVSGSITATGTLTAQTLVVQTVTSSIVYSSGSNIFGNQLTNVQQMTGSLRVTGSITSTGAATFSSSVTVSGADASTAWQKFFTGGTYMGYIGSEGGWNSNPYTDFVIGATTGRQITFYTNSVTSSRMVIASNGNVSIGGFDPTDTLGAGRVLDIGSSSGGSVILRDTTNPTTQYGAISYNGDSDNGLRIWSTGFIGFNLSGTRLVTITNSGSVGIGTSAPKTNLQISNVSGADLLSFGISDYQAWVGGKIDLQGITAFGADMVFYTHVANSSNNATVAERMRITSDGEVSINNTSTTARFNLYESAAKWAQIINHGRAGVQYMIQFQYNGSEVGAITSNNSNTTYATSSDYRLKKDLKNFNGLDLVSKLSVYDFAWKVDSTKRMYGVLAHEMAEVLPYAVNKEKDLVKEDGKIDPQGVDYSLITPLLVKAIQEQQATITSLQDRLTALENK